MVGSEGLCSWIVQLDGPVGCFSRVIQLDGSTEGSVGWFRWIVSWMVQLDGSVG